MQEAWKNIGHLNDEIWAALEDHNITMRKDYTRWLEKMQQMAVLDNNTQYLSHLHAVKEALISLHEYQLKLATRLSEKRAHQCK